MGKEDCSIIYFGEILKLGAKPGFVSSSFIYLFPWLFMTRRLEEEASPKDIILLNLFRL